MWTRPRRNRERPAGADRVPFPVSAAKFDPTAMVVGTLNSRQDLIVQGRFVAKVSLHMNNVTIARSGRVSADIHGSRICVEGQVTGDLIGEEQVVVRHTGRVRGNISAPRVVLEDGAEVKGRIDMGSGADDRPKR